MLPRSKRISRQFIKEINEKSVILHSTFFVFKIYKIRGESRLSVCIPKKIEKTAVGRNKIKRRVYSAISDIEELLNPNFAIIMQVKSNTEKLSFLELSNEIKKDFVKIRILK